MMALQSTRLVRLVIQYITCTARSWVGHRNRSISARPLQVADVAAPRVCQATAISLLILDRRVPDLAVLSLSTMRRQAAPAICFRPMRLMVTVCTTLLSLAMALTLPCNTVLQMQPLGWLSRESTARQLALLISSLGMIISLLKTFL